jgi:MFS family permease
MDRTRGSVIEGLRGDGRGWLLSAVATGWMLILGLRFTIPALLPQVKAAFTVDNATAGAAITVIWLTYAGMQFPAGALVDHVGERVLLTVSLLVTALGLLALGAAPVFGLFLLACAAFGLGTGVFGPPRGTVLSRTFEADGAAFGVTLAAGSVGAAALPFVAGSLVGQVGWRLLVAGFAPLFVGIAAATWVAVQEREQAAGAGATAREVANGVRVAITTRSVLVGVAAVTLLLFVFQGVTAFLPTYLVEQKGLDQGTAAGIYAVLFLCGAGFQLLAGGAAERFGDRAGLGSVAGFSVLPLVALPFAVGFAPLVVLSALVGVRMAIGPVNNAYLVDVLPEEVRGTAWGLLRTLFFAVGSTGSVFVGWMADQGLFDEAFVLLAILTGLGAACYLFLPSR